MHLRFVRKLEENEQEQLQGMTQQEVGRIAERAHMILLSGRGFTVPQITDIFAVSEETVYKWLDRFEAEGPPGLFDRERSGRPRRIDEEAEAELERLLEGSPQAEGYAFTTWTVPLLASHLAERMGVEASEDTVRRAVHRLKFVWRRPRWYIDSQDPAYAERMAAIARAVFAAGEDTTILVEDETTLRRLPPLRAMWMRRGQQARVAIPPGNDKFTLYGALEARTGATFTHPCPKGNSQYTTAFLQRLMQRFTGPVLLIWDQAQWHTSRAVRQVIAGYERLQVLLLPKRAPQENPVEDLWRHLKGIVAANLQRSLPALKAACRRFFRNLSNQDALRMAGLTV